jgi:hypothetical protein
MYSKKRFIQFIIYLLIVILLSSLTISCDRGTNTPYKRLRDYISTIKVINTHEHQRQPAEYAGQKHNFYTLLAYSYLNSDLVSAGAVPLRPELVNQGHLDELWGKYGQYLDFSRNTSYYSHFLVGFKVLYGLNEPYFTKEAIHSLSEKIAENYSHREQWYDQAFKAAGFEVMFLDQYWDNFNINIDNKYFALVFNINQLVGSTSLRSKMTEKEVPEEQNIYKLAQREDHAIKTLDDYLVYADKLFQKFLDHNTVCLKNSLAYGRSLDFEYIPYEKAKVLFARSDSSLSEAEKKALQDFMFHWIIQKSIEVGLPVQIHTGYLAGNGNTLENSRPTKLNNLFLRYPKATFILFHGGYPWTGEYSALGKMFPNVYLDIVWLPQISREAAVRALDEMFDGVPYNKFFWGGDCHFIEESVGSLEFGRDVVAQVLAGRIERGLMTEDVARDVALKIFRENALRVFKLEERLNRSF